MSFVLFLNVSVPLPGEEEHVGVGVVEGDQDPGGDVQGQHMLRTAHKTQTSNIQTGSNINIILIKIHFNLRS